MMPTRPLHLLAGFLALLLSGPGAVAQQPTWMAGVDLVAPIHSAIPLARGTSSERASEFAITGRLGRRAGTALTVGGTVGYRYGRARHTFDANPASLIEDKVSILSLGPFVRYERAIGPLSAVGEVAADGGVLFLGGKTIGLPFYEISQSSIGYAFSATPRAGFSFAPVRRLRVELLAGYRLGLAAAEVRLGQQQPPGTSFYTRSENRTDFYGGLEVAVGVRYEWNAPPSFPAAVPSPSPSYRSAFYVEAGGACVYYSINYEYDFDGAPGGFRARFGGSVAPSIPGGTSGLALGTVALNLIGKGNARSLVPEGGVGIVFGPSTEAVPTLSLGLRLQRPTWFARFAATVFFPASRGDYATGRDIIVLPGVSVGLPL